MKAYPHLISLFTEHLHSFDSDLNRKRPFELYQPASYILTLGGKRLRPLLALIACDLFEKDPRQALNSALAVEMFHNFSLIHDDILDAAPLRRNHPTVHKKWNTNIAILSGDAMLVKSFQLLHHYKSDEFKSLSAVFIKTALEVCEGQQLDMNFETSNTTSVEDYLHMISCKTAVLLGCSLQMGAIVAGAEEQNQIHLYEFGKQLGIAFQLLDDMLDAFALDSKKFGKQVGGDILANKKTYLLLKAIELANPVQKKEIERLMNLTSNESENKVKEVLVLFKELNIKSHCQQEADKHTRLAINALNLVKADQSKLKQLSEFAFELLNRQV